MIAELHNKISSSGSNLNERLEDQLTGDVFGALRYLPVERGLTHILMAVNGNQKEDIKTAASQLTWQNTETLFWPRYGNCEPDILLISDDTVICIEVKYQSGLSSDDGKDFSSAEGSYEVYESNHQLVREAKVLLDSFAKKKNKILLFIADELKCIEVYRDTIKRKLLRPDVSFGYISWQDILFSLSNAQRTSDEPSDLIIKDICELLNRKGFDRFTHFSCSHRVFQDKFWSLKELKTDDFHFCIRTEVNERGYYEF